MSNGDIKPIGRDMSTCIVDWLRCYRTCLDTVAKARPNLKGSGDGAHSAMMSCALMCRVAALLHATARSSGFPAG